MVSETDLMAKEEQRGEASPPSALASRKRWRRWSRGRGTVAQDVMTRRVRTIDRTEPISAGARTLLREGLRRLFVVDGNGRLVGVLAKRDLLQVFVRPDEDLRVDIEREVLRRCLWADPTEAAARVRDGEVTLTGPVELRSEARRALALTEAIPGVVAVYDELRFQVDDIAGR